MTADLTAWLEQLRAEGKLTPEVQVQADIVHRYTAAMGAPGENSEGFMKAAANAVAVLRELAAKPVHQAEVIPFKRGAG